VSKRILPLAIIILGLLAWGCESPDDEDGVGTEVTTEDINQGGQFFSFETGGFVEDYDVQFDYLTEPNPAFVVRLNTVASVWAYVETSGDFEGAVKPQGGFQSDSTDNLVIGDGWYTYNPATHTIDTKGYIYFIRGTDYTWIKLRIDGASQGTYTITYALEQSDGSFGTALTVDNLSTTDGPVNFDFSKGTTVTAANWHMGLMTIPAFDPGTEATYYMPTVLINYGNSTQAGVITDQALGEVTSVPADISWLVETADTRPLGYIGAYEILVYHPEPPYNHKVLVEHPEYVYIVATDNANYYKLRFTDYDSGIILFEYAAL